MRKIWGVIFATALMVTAAGAASATTPFEIKVFSNSTTNYKMVTPREKRLITRMQLSMFLMQIASIPKSIQTIFAVWRLQVKAVIHGQPAVRNGVHKV